MTAPVSGLRKVIFSEQYFVPLSGLVEEVMAKSLALGVVNKIMSDYLQTSQPILTLRHTTTRAVSEEPG